VYEARLKNFKCGVTFMMKNTNKMAVELIVALSAVGNQYCMRRSTLTKALEDFIC
jgi:hypothetical protein